MMTFIFLGILAGAALSTTRNWFAVALGSLTLSIIAATYEWRTGAGIPAVLSMAVIACIALQASFLTAVYVSTKFARPELPATAFLPAVDAPYASAAAPVNRNDRRMNLAGAAPVGTERRSPEAQS